MAQKQMLLTRLRQVLRCLTVTSLLCSCGTLGSRFEDPYIRDKGDLKFPRHRIYSGVATDIFYLREEYRSKTSSNVPLPLDIPLSLAVDTVLLPLTVYEQLALGSLQKAAEIGDENEVAKSLQRGEDIDGKDPWGHTALMSAAWAGHPNVTTNLIRERASINATAPRGMTALIYASREGHREVVRILLLGGADPNAKNSIGLSSLYYAAIGDHVDVAQLLLENGADINAKDNTGKAVLFVAACDGHEKIVAFLLAHGADVNGGSESDRQHPLNCALKYGHHSTVELLRKAGANE